MVLSTAVSLTTLFLTIVLGFFILIQNFRNNANRAFFVLSISISVWMVTNLLADFSQNMRGALLWTKAATIGPSFLPLTFFYLIIEIYRKEDWQKYKKLFWLFAVPAFILIFLSPTSLNIEGIVIRDWGIEYFPGPLYYFLFLYLFFGFGVTFYILSRVYAQKIEPQRSQARLMILGAALSVALALITNIILPFFGLSIASIFGPSVVLFFVCLTAIAVLKYHFINAKVIATELFTLALWITLLIKIFLSDNPKDLATNIGIFIAVAVVGVLLVRSVIQEVKQREKMEKMAEEVKRAYEVEKRANAELEKLDKYKNDFLRQTQHDLRSPLGVLKGYLELLLEGSYGKLPKEAKEIIGKMQVVVQDKIKDVNNFLDVEQFKNGKGVVSLDPDVELLPILEEIASTLLPMAEKKGIYLKLELGEDNVVISADKEKLKAAFFNVIDNAIKYTKEGGVAVGLQIANGKLLIEVKDTGIGIPPDKVKNMFEEQFERTEQAKKTAGGSGVGLYLSGQIIKMHKGKAWAESAGEGKGSSFYIELPVSGNNLAPNIESNPLKV